MYNAPPPNLMQGIYLVQSGQKTEALVYLRHAARHETLTAEGWLWLAAATDDLDEYRYSVDQALRLDAHHPVASRMRDELNRLAGWGHPAAAPAVQDNRTASPEMDTLRPKNQSHDRLSRTRRVLRTLALLVIAVICLGSAGLFALSGVVQDQVRNRLNPPNTHLLDFTVGEQPGYRFSVEVPETWLPANADNPSWRTTRDTLRAAFPAPEGQSVWEQVEASFSAAVRDPVYGDLLPKVRLVETDPKVLEQGGMVAALTLHEIVPLPDPAAQAAGVGTAGAGATGDSCARMRLLEEQFKAGGGANPSPDSVLIEAKVVTRPSLHDCVFVVHRRYTNRSPQEIPFPLVPDRAPRAMREITLAVPVGTERYAVWQITLADSAYNHYDHAIDRMVRTLDTVSGE